MRTEAKCLLKIASSSSVYIPNPPLFTCRGSFGMWKTGNSTGSSASILSRKHRVQFRNEGQIAASLYVVCDNGETESLQDIGDTHKMGIGRINHLVQVLYECAKSFSSTLECHPLARNDQKLTMAWTGVDVDLWCRQIAYQGVAYALLQAAKELVILSRDESSREPDPTSTILSPKLSLLMKCIQNQLHAREPELVKWFMMEQLTPLTRNFVLLIERWSQRDKQSYVAATVQAISCCVAIMKLGARRISCQSFTMHLPELITELVNFAHTLVPIDILHKLAIEAGFEYEFLRHFGEKILRHDASRDSVFWMELIQKKLVVALQRENVTNAIQCLCNSKVLLNELATLGFFAYLGRKTRLFISQMGIKDVDEHVGDFLCYLECGILFYYPELSSMCVYLLFMEVVTEEIGWIDFYTEIPCIKHQERKRTKQHTIQAEKEIIISTILNVCSDAFSSFVHFSNKTQLSMDENLVEYLLQSQNMLKVCQVDFLAAYDRPRKLLKPSELIPQSWIIKTVDISVSLGEPHSESKLLMRDMTGGVSHRMLVMNKLICSDKILEKALEIDKQCFSNLKFFTGSSSNVLSTICDFWMGTRLLCANVAITLDLLRKRMWGHSLSKREIKLIAKTAVDVAFVIPIIILILLPVTAIGHAAMFAAIKKYTPGLIPSPYSRAKLDVLKQLQRAKKMRMQPWGKKKASSVSNK